MDEVEEEDIDGLEEEDDDDALLEEDEYEDEEDEAALAIPPLGTYLGAAASGGGSPASASGLGSSRAGRGRRGSTTARDELPPAGLGDDEDIAIHSWGQAAYHELGHGDAVERDTPTPIGAFYVVVCGRIGFWKIQDRHPN